MPLVVDIIDKDDAERDMHLTVAKNSCDHLHCLFPTITFSVDKAELFTRHRYQKQKIKLVLKKMTSTWKRKKGFYFW